jgi:hypothetical protein
VGAEDNGSAQAGAFLQLFEGRSDCFGRGGGLCVRQPLTEAVIAAHLEGQGMVGVYPLREDGTTTWVCCDLDMPAAPEEERWTAARSLYDALRCLGAYPFLERSKSKGFHAWIFFGGPVEARFARRLAQRALDDAGLDGEIFPKQDALSETAPIGNYVYLPYPGRSDGRQVMVNPETGEGWGLAEFLDAVIFSSPEEIMVAPDESTPPRTLKAEATGRTLKAEPAAADLLGEDAPYGTRHNRAKRVIGLLARRLQPDGVEAVLAAAEAWNLARCQPALPTAEVRRMVEDFWAKQEQGRVPEAESLHADTLDTLLADEDEALDAVIGDGGEGAVLTADGKGFVAGPTGVGKTNLLLRLSRCLCEASPFLGLPVSQPRRVLYVILEGSRRGIRRRLRKVWADAPEEAKSRFFLIHTRLDVGRKEDLTRLHALVAQVQPEVLIIDPLRNLHGWDENASDAAAHLTAILDGIIDAYACAIVCAHHDRKRPPFVRRDMGTDRVRGSTALTGWLSFCLSIDADPQEPDTLLAEWTKLRDAEALLPPLSLRFNRQTLDFSASERQAGGKVSDDTILSAVFGAGGRIKGVDLIRGLQEGCGASERWVRERLRRLVASGELIPYTADPKTNAKGYALPQEADVED